MSTDIQITDEMIDEFIFNYASFVLKDEVKKQWEQFKASKQLKPEWEIVLYRIKDTGKLLAPHVTISGDPETEIYSVKRLSDGEVFSIGDDMTMENRTETIIGFEIIGSIHMMAKHKDSGSWNIMFVKKAKAVLFTTEDGVVIYTRDHYWFVDCEFNINEWEASEMNNKGDSGKRCFSTKEKAEEWVLWHRPLISLSEIKGNSTYFDVQSNYFKRLIELAKDKLNLK